MKFIFFEGIDGIGKSTIEKSLQKRTDYAYITADRFVISSCVYDYVLRKRTDRLKDFLHFAKELGGSDFDVICIYLYSSNRDLARKRFEENLEKEKIVTMKNEDFNQLYNLYELFVDLLENVHVHKIDVFEKTIDQICEEIYSQIDE